QGPARKLVKLQLADDASQNTIIPRHGMMIFAPDGSEIGSITSGALSDSQSSHRAIALGYVSASLAETGNEVLIEIDSDRISAEIVKVPGN
ncbi:MAG TPA: glycine cleavage system aminomethyltransferase GcvT, partial [Phycisphaerae bacterium]|nr:glycine cleavage system aminomethyltransferase GcvT [Phycisphaerae bacterium]